MKAVKSITTNSVYGKPTKEDIGKTLMHVAGIVDSYFTKEGKYGENTGLKGDFVSVNAITGEKFASSCAFLPSQITDNIVDQLKEGVIEIEFTASIVLVESDKNDKGYAYVAEAPKTEERKAKAAHLVEVAKSFPLAIEDKKGKNKTA